MIRQFGVVSGSGSGNVGCTAVVKEGKPLDIAAFHVSSPSITWLLKSRA